MSGEGGWIGGSGLARLEGLLEDHSGGYRSLPQFGQLASSASIHSLHASQCTPLRDGTSAVPPIPTPGSSKKSLIEPPSVSLESRRSTGIVAERCDNRRSKRVVTRFRRLLSPLEQDRDGGLVLLMGSRGL